MTAYGINRPCTQYRGLTADGPRAFVPLCPGPLRIVMTYLREHQPRSSALFCNILVCSVLLRLAIQRHAPQVGGFCQVCVPNVSSFRISVVPSNAEIIETLLNLSFDVREFGKASRHFPQSVPKHRCSPASCVQTLGFSSCSSPITASTGPSSLMFFHIRPARCHLLPYLVAYQSPHCLHASQISPNVSAN
ncbi:hypothetical protein BDN70DRAFT_165501 [Pholiota conissans]|uniref:Uncharacterized protein n=1 Tax=Pholiota conissans TaxID=109636 RepID=A0A9P5YWR6_9AGAR|nr:hypothetical protein BDN70DRAFT_165501 [Pholiota conissans]